MSCEQCVILTAVAAAEAKYRQGRREEAMFAHLRLQLAQAENQQKIDDLTVKLTRLDNEYSQNVVDKKEAGRDAAAAQTSIAALRLSGGTEDHGLTQLEGLRREYKDKRAALAEARREEGTWRTQLRERARAWEKWLGEAVTLGWKINFDTGLIEALRGNDPLTARTALQSSRDAFQSIHQDITEKIKALGDEIVGLRIQREALQARLDQIQRGSPRPTPLLDALLGRNIQAHSLGRVVEVSERGEVWWGTLEKLLGDEREAVLLDDETDYLEAAELWARLPDAEPLLCPVEVAQIALSPTHSLAALLDCSHSLARRFLTMRLGHLAAVRSAREFDKHPAGAATPDGLIHAPPSLYRIIPEVEVSLGTKGLTRLRQSKEKDLALADEELRTKTQRQSNMYSWLIRGRESKLHEDMWPPAHFSREQIEALEHRVEELVRLIEAVSNLDREERLRQIKVHEAEWQTHVEGIGKLNDRISSYDLDRKRASDDLEGVRSRLLESSIVVQEDRAKLSTEIHEEELQARLQRVLTSQVGWTQRREDAVGKVGEWKLEAEKQHSERQIHRQRLFTPEHTSDHTDFDVNEDSNARFDERLADLNDHQLEKYKQLAKEREIQWEERLQNDVLEKLGDRLEEAGRTVDDFRRLFGREIGTQRYILRQWRNPSYHAVWKLIDASQNGETLQDELFEYSLRDEIAAAKRELMAAVDDAQGVDTSKVLDYRNYHHYDLDRVPEGESDDCEGAVSLQDNVKKSSGGEGQAPFFVMMLGAFHRVYDAGRSTGRPSLGIVVMDEAFSKLSADHIDDCLQLAESFGLQLILAFPVDRVGAMIERADSIIQCRVQKDYEHGIPVQIINDVIYWEREKWLAEML